MGINLFRDHRKFTALISRESGGAEVLELPSGSGKVFLRLSHGKGSMIRTLSTLSAKVLIEQKNLNSYNNQDLNMENTIFFKGTLTTFMVMALAIAAPATAGTKDDIKALQEEVAALKESQAGIQNDLAEIKKMLEQRPAAPAARQAAAPFEPKDLEVGDSPVLGNADATVTMFAYSDYQCPFCSRHATTVLPSLVNDYVETGQLRIVMREYPIEAIHPRAFAASQAALCAGSQGKYWEMHDLIFANQRALSDEDLLAHAKSLELDLVAYDACLGSTDVSEQIQAEIQEAYSLGISGTPSFVAGLTSEGDADKVRVTEYIRGAQSFDRFKGVIDGLLEESEGNE